MAKCKCCLWLVKIAGRVGSGYDVCTPSQQGLPTGSVLAVCPHACELHFLHSFPFIQAFNGQIALSGIIVEPKYSGTCRNGWNLLRDGG